MPKKIVKDIIVRKKKDKSPALIAPSLSKRHSRSKSLGKIIFAALFLVLVAIFSVKIIGVFAKTIVQINLRKEIISIDTMLKSGKTSDFDLPLETMEIRVTEQRTTKATGVEAVETKASGQIVIYNSFSSQPQTLIVNTRFETPEGKIYRTNHSVVVPGAKIEEGKIIANSVEVAVSADKPGEEYNIDLTDFTIPGFKGGPRYEKFYARSKTVMGGGFKGTVPVISDEDLENIRKELESSLRIKLIEQARSQTPDEFVLYEDAIEITFTEEGPGELSEAANENPMFTIKKTGALFAPIFEKIKLLQILVGKYLGEGFQGKVKIANIEELNFQLISKDAERNMLIFRIKGEAEFVWVVDEEKLKEALIASPEDLSGVFSKYSAINHAAVVFRPAWWKFFPKKPSKILIECVGE